MRKKIKNKNINNKKTRVIFFIDFLFARPENLQPMSLADSQPFTLLNVIGQFPCFKILNQIRTVGHSCAFYCA